MIVTKFDRNPIKYVEEETDCQKEERKKERMKMNFWPLWPLDDPWGHIKYNFCSYPPMHDCDQVWWKSDKVCGRRNRLPERRKKQQETSKLGDAA